VLISDHPATTAPPPLEPSERPRVTDLAVGAARAAQSSSGICRPQRQHTWVTAAAPSSARTRASAGRAHSTQKRGNSKQPNSLSTGSYTGMRGKMAQVCQSAVSRLASATDARSQSAGGGSASAAVCAAAWRALPGRCIAAGTRHGRRHGVRAAPARGTPERTRPIRIARRSEPARHMDVVCRARASAWRRQSGLTARWYRGSAADMSRQSLEASGWRRGCAPDLFAQVDRSGARCLSVRQHTLVEPPGGTTGPHSLLGNAAQV
jgi:hypothetical protein